MGTLYCISSKTELPAEAILKFLGSNSKDTHGRGDMAINLCFNLSAKRNCFNTVHMEVSELSLLAFCTPVLTSVHRLQLVT